MSSNKDEWEWDRERIIYVALIIIIIVGIGYIAVANMPVSRARNVIYTLTVDRDTDRIDTVYRTYWGHSVYMENASLVTAKLQIADVPDVSQIVISVYTILPTRLIAIVVAEYPAESSVLHGQDQVPIEYINYVVTLGVGQRNLIVYMFFENVHSGSFEFAVNSF